VSEQETFLQIDTDAEIAAIIGKLNKLPDQIAAPNILKNALNATARKVRKQIVKDAAGQYAIKDKSILKQEDQGAPKVYTASAADLAATIRSRGPMQDIMAFMTKPNSDTGAAAAKVLQSGTLTTLEAGGLKAFVTTFANGHTAIVQRHPPAEYSTGRNTRAGRYGEGADMTKIKKLLSPAVPHMLGNEKVMAQSETLTYETLQAEIQKRIDKITAAQ
jgi:hypothetical protein